MPVPCMPWGWSRCLRSALSLCAGCTGGPTSSAPTSRTPADGLAFAARVVTGHLRLLVGMVVANQPWRLAARLSRALVAAVAAGVFALVTSDVWRLADTFGAWRHVGVALGSVLGLTATLVLGAQLWERAPDRRVRQQVLLVNTATTGTGSMRRPTE